MKKLIENISFWLLRKKYVYKGKNCIILTDTPLSEDCQEKVSIFINEDYKKEKIKISINKTMMDMIGKHKGTIEDGKCFIASDDFVIGLNKKGKAEPIVDCNSNR